MSSYTDVKNLIISNIKANGQREITGPILQDVLLNMLENSSRVEEITYSDLKALRDGAKLTPSRLYRITDYITTTVQSNTKSARHPFDVIVLALSESELLEQAWAIQHEGDEYFTNSNLSDWELWYCLDNDTTRFAWADSTNGKGVIYRMIDEFGNDCPYDFKNIQFYRQWNEAKQLWSTISNGAVGVPCYTFSSKGDSSATEFTDTTLMLDRQVYDNTIKAGTLSNQVLNNNCFFGDGCYGNTFESSCSYNTFGNNCQNNSFGSNCWNNTFGSNCNYNTFGSNCNYNSFGSNCWNNTFESSCVDNIFYGDCLKNSFGISCQRNTFGSSCRNNTFYGNCWNNIFESSCLGNTFESSCDDNFFGENCNYNTFGSNCKGNSLGISCQGNSLGNNCQNNSFGSNCWNNTFGNVCYYIKFASDKSASTKYNYYRNNHFGDGCQYILFKCAETASASAQVQNYKFAQGLQGTSDEYLAIDGKRNRSYETYISRDTDGTIKESVIAEFENRLGNCVDLTTEQTINAAKTFSAGIDLNGTIISKVGSPINADDATNKEYVDDTVKTVDDKVNDFKNAGYLYAGIATSLTNPGTPDTKVFYIANGKGVYTNFGGLEVTEDDVVILYYDTIWHKVATGIASNEKLAELSDYAHKSEVRHIERDLGMYSELEPVPLNSEVTGKYINSDGKYVDASDWNIASIGAVSLGNTYLLNMVSSTNMVLGVALFVSRVYKRDKEGKIIGTTLTPLFSAKNTSIPASGYVLFEAMDDYEEVLICYKPALTTQMLVARWGFKASHATQLRNLRLVVDNKTDFEGIYELLTAGYALNLVGKGNGEPQAFMSRKTGGGNITDGSAVIKEVDGVKPIVWNQLMKFKSSTVTIKGITYEIKSDGQIHIYGTANEQSTSVYYGQTGQIVANHKHLIIGGGSGTISGEANGVLPSINGSYGIVSATRTSKSPTWFFRVLNGVTIDIEFRPMLLDLTQMFGAGNEPSTYEEYLDRISHYHIADEYAYNAGEVVNYKGVGIKTTNVDGTKTYVRDWREVMKKYFPDGMTNLNGVKDFFNERKAVRKYGVVDLGELSWTKDTHWGADATYFSAILPGGKVLSNSNAICAKYEQKTRSPENARTTCSMYDGDSVSRGYINIADKAYDNSSANDFKTAVKGVKLYYELSEPVEDIFEKPLNLTYTVINGGTETSLATENSTQFEGSIAYNKDYVAVVDELQMQNRVIQIEFENWEN